MFSLIRNPNHDTDFSDSSTSDDDDTSISMTTTATGDATIKSIMSTFLDKSKKRGNLIVPEFRKRKIKLFNKLRIILCF